MAAALCSPSLTAAARAPRRAATTAAAAVPYGTSYDGPRGLMFLGSWSGDSVLMQLSPREEEGAEGGGGGGGREAKRQRQEGGEGPAAAAAAAAAVKEEEAAGQQRYSLRMLDSLPSLGEDSS